MLQHRVIFSSCFLACGFELFLCGGFKFVFWAFFGLLFGFVCLLDLGFCFINSEETVGRISC